MSECHKNRQMTNNSYRVMVWIQESSNSSDLYFPKSENRQQCTKHYIAKVAHFWTSTLCDVTKWNKTLGSSNTGDTAAHAKTFDKKVTSAGRKL